MRRMIVPAREIIIKVNRNAGNLNPSEESIQNPIPPATAIVMTI